MTRRMDLLRLAAVALNDMRDPFDHSFLVEHAVTLNECGDLADDLAAGARLLIANAAERAAGGIRAKVAVDQLVRSLL